MISDRVYDSDQFTYDTIYNLRFSIYKKRVNNNVLYVR